MLPRRLFGFVRPLHVLSPVLSICGLQMYAQPPKATGTYITIDIPIPEASRTLRLEGINPRGDVVGAYRDSSGTVHNFLLSNGTFQEINPPGAGFDSLFLAKQMGINPQGDVVSSFGDSSGFHGFLLSHGTYTIIDVPGANPFDFATDAAGIDLSGDIVGFYSNNNCSHGFLLSRGTYTTIDVPVGFGAGAVPCTTNATAINPQGDILGEYVDSRRRTHGYLLSNGNFSPIDMPGAVVTFPFGMNPQGDIVGLYADSSSFHGFLLTRAGTVTIIDVPNSCTGCTAPYDINPQGDIVGQYFDSSFKSHGFLFKRTDSN